jgi:hypothetical protein
MKITNKYFKVVLKSCIKSVLVMSASRVNPMKFNFVYIAWEEGDELGWGGGVS